MKNASAAVDAYIAKAPAYSQPILKKLRQLFHRACPHIGETIKWGVPTFEHKGIVGGMAAFKQYVRFGFWKGRLLSDPNGLFKGGDDIGMQAQKLTSVADLPADDVLVAFITSTSGWSSVDMYIFRGLLCLISKFPTPQHISHTMYSCCQLGPSVSVSLSYALSTTCNGV